MRRRGARLRRGVIALASCAAGCAGLLGIDDDHCRRGTEGCGEGAPAATTTSEPNQPAPVPSSPDVNPLDASAPPSESDASTQSAGPEDPCDRYCGVMAARCTGEESAYLEGDCAELCPYFPRAVAGGAANTLECRLSVVEGPLREPSTECPGAGRGGDSICGSNCDSYCHLMRAICPLSFTKTFPTDESCQLFCKNELDDPGGFDAVEAEQGVPRTVQCRLWHLGAAAGWPFPDDGALGNVHCVHARGEAVCVLPDTDAGAR